MAHPSGWSPFHGYSSLKRLKDSGPEAGGGGGGKPLNRSEIISMKILLGLNKGSQVYFKIHSCAVIPYYTGSFLELSDEPELALQRNTGHWPACQDLTPFNSSYS